MRNDLRFKQLKTCIETPDRLSQSPKKFGSNDSSGGKGEQVTDRDP